MVWDTGPCLILLANPVVVRPPEQNLGNADTPWQYWRERFLLPEFGYQVP